MKKEECLEDLVKLLKYMGVGSMLGWTIFGIPIAHRNLTEVGMLLNYAEAKKAIKLENIGSVLEGIIIGAGVGALAYFAKPYLLKLGEKLEDMPANIITKCAIALGLAAAIPTFYFTYREETNPDIKVKQNNIEYEFEYSFGWGLTEKSYMNILDYDKISAISYVFTLKSGVPELKHYTKLQNNIFTKGDFDSKIQNQLETDFEYFKKEILKTRE